MNSIDDYLRKYCDFIPDTSSIMDDDGFKPYLLVPDYMLNHFHFSHVKHDRKKVRERLTLFSVWLKAMDRIVDFSPESGLDQLKIFSQPNVPVLDINSCLSQALGRSVQGRQREISPLMMEMYHLALLEGKASSMSDYIEAKRNCGVQCGRVILGILEDVLDSSDERFFNFYINLVGATQVLDSAVDLTQDVKRGELGFTPSLRDKFTLYKTAILESLSQIRSHPFLLRGLPSNFYSLAKGKF